MTPRKPLDLMKKWHVLQYWATRKPPLRPAAYLVLSRLLERQNTKTGRCDPSAVGLAEEISYSERSVRSSFKELEERGAIKRYRASKRSRNQFLIHSVAELQQIQHFAELRMRSGQRTGMKPVSAAPAIHCRPNLKRAAPETRKETIKKKGSAERDGALIGAVLPAGLAAPTSEMGMGEFERNLARAFDRKGYGYQGLLELPVGTVEQAYADLEGGKLSFTQVVDDLLDQYRRLSNDVG